MVKDDSNKSLSAVSPSEAVKSAVRVGRKGLNRQSGLGEKG